jgi:hypothetical protein
MSSPPCKKRAASPSEENMAPKRRRSNTLVDADDKNVEDQEPENSHVAMQSKAVTEFYPEVSKRQCHPL